MNKNRRKKNACVETHLDNRNATCILFVLLFGTNLRISGTVRSRFCNLQGQTVCTHASEELSKMKQRMSF